MTYYESSVESAAQMLREAQRIGRRVRVWGKAMRITAIMECHAVTYFGKGATLEEALFNLSHHEAF